MPERLRKFIGMIALVVLVVVYSLFAISIPIQNISPIMQAVFYVVAGFAWVIPAGFIVTWMQKPGRTRS